MCRQERSADGLRAPVNRIIPFSSVDGPGNRTAIFLQGCDWDCQYCHNPETRKLCINCSECVKACPAGALGTDAEGKTTYDVSRCVFCDTCIRTCRHDASPRIQWLTPGETFRRVEAQLPFIRGVTVSGGECCLYPDFLKELFVLCRERGVGTMIDSNGSLPLEGRGDLLAVTDAVMLDVKAFDPAEHRRVTGADNAEVLKNAVFLAERGKLYEIRTVVVPGLFSAGETVRETCRLLAPYLETAPIRYKLIAYRENGVRPRFRIYDSPSAKELQELEEIAREEGFSDIICT